MLTCLAVIPARGGSKRIPEKNIIDFYGRPLVSYSISAANDAGFFDTVHVSTESPRVRDAVQRMGHDVPFLRPASLAQDDTPLPPVMKWALERIEATRGTRFDVVCLITATAPLIEASDLRQGMEMYQRFGGQRSVLAVARYPAPVGWAFTLAPDGALTPVDPNSRMQSSHEHPPAYYDTGTFAFFSRDRVVEGRIRYDDFAAIVLPQWKGVDIDEPEDLELARILYAGARLSGRPGT